VRAKIVRLERREAPQLVITPHALAWGPDSGNRPDKGFAALRSPARPEDIVGNAGVAQDALARPAMRRDPARAHRALSAHDRSRASGRSPTENSISAAGRSRRCPPLSRWRSAGVNGPNALSPRDWEIYCLLHGVYGRSSVARRIAETASCGDMPLGPDHVRPAIRRCATGRLAGHPSVLRMLVGPASPRVEEPVLAGFSLAPTGAVDESDDPGARTSVIGLPRAQQRRLAPALPGCSSPSSGTRPGAPAKRARVRRSLRA
jgi:hypothetical protein